MLVRNVDVMFHILVLEQELALCMEIRLRWLVLIERYKLIRLHLLCVTLARTLNGYHTVSFSSLGELDSLHWRRLHDEPESLGAGALTTHNLRVILC